MPMATTNAMNDPCALCAQRLYPDHIADAGMSHKITHRSLKMLGSVLETQHHLNLRAGLVSPRENLVDPPTHGLSHCPIGVCAVLVGTLAHPFEC